MSGDGGPMKGSDVMKRVCGGQVGWMLFGLDDGWLGRDVRKKERRWKCGFGFGWYGWVKQERM